MSQTIQDLSDAEIELIERMARRIQPHLDSLSALVQGGVIAALLARWLYGHEIVGDVARTDELRERLLHRHCALVMKLLAANELDGGGIL